MLGVELRNVLSCAQHLVPFDHGLAQLGHSLEVRIYRIRKLIVCKMRVLTDVLPQLNCLN